MVTNAFSIFQLLQAKIGNMFFMVTPFWFWIDQIGYSLDKLDSWQGYLTKPSKVLHNACVCRNNFVSLVSKKMDRPFKEYTRVRSKIQVKYILNLFKENGIEYKLETDIPIDEIVDDDILTKQIVIKIDIGDFNKANGLLRENAINTITEEDINDHFLNEYSNDELIELLKFQDEWGFSDVLISQKILQKRGLNYTDEDLNKFWHKRLEDIRSSKSLHEYEKALLVFLLIATVIIYLMKSITISRATYMIIIPWATYIFKWSKIDPEGKSFYVYDNNSREFSKLILKISVLILIFFELSPIFIYLYNYLFS